VSITNDVATGSNGAAEAGRGPAPRVRSRFHSIVEGGLDWQALPMRLFVQGNQKFWDPSQIDMSHDAEHWKLLDQEQQEGIAGLAVSFMIGEEAVTQDIQPFMYAMAVEGRLEDEMYLTQFALEEAKHVEAFRRWLDALWVTRDMHDALDATGVGGSEGIFTTIQPEAMGRLWTDPSPRNQIRANVVYNQFVEGTLALSGYWAWAKILDALQGLFPGMREIIRQISRDERRHLAWGTYNIRRHVAADDAMWEVAKADLDEMKALMEVHHEQTMADTSPQAEAFRQQGRAIGIGPEDQWQYQLSRLERRYGAIESARGVSAEQIEHDFEDEADEEGYASLV
jgi:ribonucleoside-diphosphate reductase beta chain